MRMITKGPEPQNLAQYRMQNNPAGSSAFNDYPHKDELRSLLISEQKALCCYCMGRIHNDPLKMKIEHWQCQDRYQGGRLAYGNMLGACLGGQKQSADEHHCDTKKGNRDLKWSPAVPAHMIESRLRYLADGTIEGIDPVFDDQINSVLNLNLPKLKNNRKVVLESVLHWWRSTPNARQKVQQQIDRRTGNLLEYQPFSPVAVWFLRRKLGATAI